MIGLIWALKESKRRENDQYLQLKKDLRDHNQCPISINRKDLISCNTSNERCDQCNTPSVCVTVSNEHPYYASMGLDQINNKPLPNGKWCLPPKRVFETPCHPQTGVRVLTKDGVTLRWKCKCKAPHLVTNNSVDNDCTNVVACQTGGTLICPSGHTQCTEGTPWTPKSNWDPMEGICTCPDGKHYQATPNAKICLSDVCSPGTTDILDATQCKCPPHYVNYSGRCLPDPCTPGVFNGINCTCPRKSKNVLDPTSIVGHACQTPCSKKRNPCGKKGSYRGKCKFDESTQRAICTSCAWPYYQSKDKRCNNFVLQQGKRCTAHNQCEGKQCKRGCGATVYTFKMNKNKYCC